MRRRITIMVSAVTIVVLFLALKLRSSQPFYEGKPLEYWCEKIKDEGYNETFPVFDERAFPHFVRCLRKSGDATAQIRLLYVIEKDFGRSATNAVKELVACLSSTDPAVVDKASDVLSLTGTSSIPVLTLSLSDPSKRFGAMATLGKMGEAAGSAVPALTNMFTDPDVPIKRFAVYTLGNIGVGAIGAVPYLEKISRENDRATRLLAIQARWKITKNADNLIPLVLELAESSDSVEREEAYRLLNEFGTDGTTNRGIFSSGLVAESEKIRFYSASALIGVPSFHEAAIGVLVHLTRGGMRMESMQLLATIQPLSLQASNALFEISQRESDALSPLAASILNGPGVKTPSTNE